MQTLRYAVAKNGVLFSQAVDVLWRGALQHRLTSFVLLAMLLGVGFGLACHVAVHDRGALGVITDALGLLTTIFLRAIRMIIAPLVFSTLISGIGRIDESSTIGRIALRAMVWFVLASLVALLVALLAANVLTPGAGMHLRAVGASVPSVSAPLSAAGFVAHLVPVSIVEALANNEILQIVVFALVAGVAVSRMGTAGEPLMALAEAVSLLMLRITRYVMSLAPLAVFGAVASVLTTKGIGIVADYALYVGGFYVALLAIWLVMLAAGAAILGRAELARLLGMIRQLVLIAFTTASSEAVYPSLLAKLEAYGVPNNVASLVLPLGYSFNLVGSICFCIFAVLFLAQAYDVPLSAAAVAQLLLLVFVMSKGIAGVPRAGILIIAALLPYFHIPDAGVAIILGVDQFLDMGRTATNTVANGLAAASVAKWERAI